MATRAVVTLTEGGKGVGKTFRRGPHFLINEFLAQKGGVCYTNLPIFRDAVARVMATRTGRDEQSFIERIQVIGEADLQRWADGESGPWDYFADVPLAGCHIQIDEAHNYAGTHHKKEHIGRWMEWLGEVRHLAVTVELISQHVMKMAPAVRREVAVKLYLKTTEDHYDPWFKIKIGDWYELFGAFTRRYDVFVVEEESRENRNKWEVVDTRVFLRDPFYFTLYDSYATPVKGGVKGHSQKREYEKRSRLGMVWWFYSRHWFKLTRRLLFVAIIVWLFGFGGMSSVFAGCQARMMDRLDMGPSAPVEAVASGGPAPTRIGEVRSPTVPAIAVERTGVTPGPGVDGGTAVDRPGPVSVSPPSVALAVHDQALARIEDLQTKLVSSEAEVQRLTGLLNRASSVTLLERDRVTFREGYSYGVGDVIDFGAYAGRSVASIDWARRTVELDDGQILRMGNQRGGGRVDGGVSNSGASSGGS